MESLTAVFRSLSDEARLRMLNLLFDSGELCVCDLESTLGFTQTKVSRHAGYLKRAGLVKDRRVGRWILYSIAEPKTEEQRLIITNVREILQSHKRTQKDSKKLRKNVEEGCCVTFAVVKPNDTLSKVSTN